MHSKKVFSLAGRIGCILALSLSVACSIPTASPQDEIGNASDSNTNDSTQVAGVSGIVFSGRSIDGRLVPPTTPVNVKILNRDDEEVTSTTTDNLGRFFINDIPATEEGSTYTIQVGNLFDEQRVFFPGRILNLSSIESNSLKDGSQEEVTISATLLNSSKQPLSNVTVQDKDFIFRQTTTDSSGQFTLEVVSDEVQLILSESQPPIPIAVSEIQQNQILTVETDNIRTISGTVIDSTNSNLPLGNVKLKVRGRGVSTTTNEDGSFALNGAPAGPFILEAEAENGYSPLSLQIPPAEFDSNQRPLNLQQNLELRPIGSVLINFSVEDAPGFDRLPCSPTNVGFNCRRYDVNNGEPAVFYHNAFGTLNPLTTTITVEGTGIQQEVTYPASQLIPVRGTDELGDLVTIDEAIRTPNVVFSVRLDDVPGGKQNITIAMTGMQTQKSIPVYIPSNDIISTERITLYRVRPVNSFGDVSGFLKGLDPNVPGNVKIGYLDLGEDLSYEPSLGDETAGTPPGPFDLITRVQESLNSNRAVLVDKNTGKYYLKNVPTGTRVALAAAVVDENGEISDCYIPNTSVLLNVRAGEVNFAPDVTMALRPNEEGCTAN